MLYASLFGLLSSLTAATAPLGNALPFQHFGTEQGLRSLDAYCVSEDLQGFIWVGTRNGLSRFDGVQFVEPAFVAERDALIAAREAVQTLLRDRRGKLWFGVEGRGLYQLDPSTFELKRIAGYQDDIWALSEDAQGDVWIGTYKGGLHRAGADGRSLKQYRHNPDVADSLCGDSILAMKWLREDLLAIGTLDGGVCTLEPSTGRFARLPADPSGALDNFSALAFASDAHGSLLIGGSDGLIRVDAQTQIATLYQANPADPFALSDKTVNSIATDRRGRTWVTTNRGFNLWDPATLQFKNFRRVGDGANGLRSDSIYQAFVDSQDGLWLATLGGGMSRLPSDFERFAIFLSDPKAPTGLPAGAIEATASDSPDELWFGARHGGLARLRLGTASAENALLRHPDRASQDRIWALTLSPQDLWIGTHVGVRRLKRSSFQLDPIVYGPRVATDALALLDSGLLLAGSFSGGLVRIDPASGLTESIDQLLNVEQIVILDAKRALVAAQSGLFVVDGLRLQPIALEQTSRVTALRLDGQKLQIATGEQLLEGRFDGQRFSATRTTDWPQELQPVVVGTILPGANQGLVLTTRRGLLLVDESRGQFKLLDEHYGLPCSEFSDRPATLAADGRAYMGLACGAVSFDPKRLLNLETAPPRVHFTELSVERDGQRVSLDRTRQVTLSHTDRELKFAVTALGFDREAPLEIQIDGLETHFVKVRAGTEQRLSQLPVGTFQIRARALGEDNRPGAEAAPLVINQLAAPWLTRTAWLLYALVAFALLAFLWRLARARLRAAHEAREITARMATAEQHLEFAESLNRALDPNAVLDTLYRGLKQSIAHTDSALHLLITGRSMEPHAADTLNTVVHHRDRAIALVELKRQAPFSEREQAIAQTYRAQAEVALDKAYLLIGAHALAAKADSANRAKGAFLAKMSHEIRTPLHGILGMAEMLERRTQDAASKEDLSALNRAGGALLTVLNDVLDLSRLQADRAPQRVQVFGLKELLREVCELFTPAARDRGLRLSVQLDSSVARRISSDRQALRQSLMNLTGNAIKFTTHGHIELQASQTADRLSLAVIDSGPGIAPELHATLFDPFTQGEDAHGSQHKGSGLGLAIVKELITRMHGTIRLESSVGHGSRFEIEVPVGYVEAEIWQLTRSSKEPSAAQVFDSPFALIAALGAAQPDRLIVTEAGFSEIELLSLQALQMLAPGCEVIHADARN